MTKQPKGFHGGPRPHPPGREGGRPKNLYSLHIIKIQCTPEELATILANIPDTRKRTEILLGAK